ncbi:uncharacterized protein [Rutidosis leptorrhynchoides]|uniref:uncharacterized protein n=1 Tax=Rutidosis leptorrhynchoides TaxID=125765 RepID=UPI003A99CAF3
MLKDLCIDGLERCYFLDFLGPEGFAAELSRRTSCQVIGFDHRKTTLSDIHLYEDCNTNLSYQEHSACLFNTEDRERVKMVPKYIEDGDLRRWTLPDIKEFNIGLSKWRSKLNCITNSHLFDQVTILHKLLEVNMTWILKFVPSSKKTCCNYPTHRTFQIQKDLQFNQEFEKAYHV